jgi:DNA-binding transcriptional ArsR family regulator
MKEIERILKALANKRRLAIIRHLMKKREDTVGNIAEGIGLSLKATSKHLSILLAANIVDKEQRSLEMWYTLSSRRHVIVRFTSKYISNSRE